MSNVSKVSKENLYDAYKEYNKTLRAWFVAYGVGLPALVLTNEKLIENAKNSGEAKLVAWLFAAGVLLQLSIAALNKWANWFQYWGAIDTSFTEKPSHKFALWWGEHPELDVAAEVLTAIFFGLGTFRILSHIM